MESFQRCTGGVFVYIAKQPSTSQPLCRKDQRVHVITAVRGWVVQEPDSVDSRHTCSYSSPLSALCSPSIRYIYPLWSVSSLRAAHKSPPPREARARRAVSWRGWPPYLLSLALCSRISLATSLTSCGGNSRTTINLQILWVLDSGQPRLVGRSGQGSESEWGLSSPL